MFARFIADLFEHLSDLHRYSRLSKLEKDLAKLDAAERLIHKLRREALSQAYAEWVRQNPA
jgi:hypothetical protein